jgi:hypothetical protein
LLVKRKAFYPLLVRPKFDALLAGNQQATQCREMSLFMMTRIRLLIGKSTAKCHPFPGDITLIWQQNPQNG